MTPSKKVRLKPDTTTRRPGSAERSRQELDPLPPALSSMWRLCTLGYRHEPRLMLVAFVLSQVAALPDALLAVGLMVLGNAAVHRQTTVMMAAALALGVSATATWFLMTVSTRVQRRFRDRVTIALEAHVATLQASIVTLAHHERPDYLDRLSMLRHQVFVLDHMYMSLFTTCGWILRLAVTVAALAYIHPALVLLVVFAIPTVYTATWRPAVERVIQERGEQANRLARHLFTTATTAAAGKEVRVTRIGQRLIDDRRAAWERAFVPIAQVRWRTAAWHTAAWALFGAAYVGGVVFVAWGLHATPGAVLLVLAAGSRLSTYVGATVSELGFLRGFWMDGSRRLAWLEDYATAVAATPDLPVPTVLTQGIRFDRVSFAYPGTSKLALEDVSLTLPAGAIVAVVGENGAGKTTLVKLLARMYDPADGAILVDGQPLSRMPAVEWRDRMAGAFQDFVRLEFIAQHSVGLGDLPQLDREEAVTAAVGRAGATDVVEKLPAGLATQLGATWPGGTDLSFGQWQKVALARGFMREAPLVLVLDEPTAALDAETEHALFERYAEAARQVRLVGRDPRSGPGGTTGRITVLVSHRFSTVRMADLIVVMDGARVVETGTHDQLMAQGGRYAELYRIQARAYR